MTLTLRQIVRAPLAERVEDPSADEVTDDAAEVVFRLASVAELPHAAVQAQAAVDLLGEYVPEPDVPLLREVEVLPPDGEEAVLFLLPLLLGGQPSGLLAEMGDRVVVFLPELRELPYSSDELRGGLLSGPDARRVVEVEVVVPGRGEMQVHGVILLTPSIISE